ncbi:unnamed protein product [Prorocentrum cordatum]|uniref:RanBP2-type domain-containing protein n=1 Tax=Prorocentrum cordatum TaxID=2364126 RepID=A0ABN9VA24_9DINO|nr:unnamed protein product [Polarella glacialis]
MEWTTVSRGRRGRPKQAGSAALAAEVLRSLFTASGGRGGGQPLGAREPRRPEWCCTGCSATNFEERRSCRRCGAARRGAAATCPPPPPADSGADAKAGLAQQPTTNGAGTLADRPGWGKCRPPAPEEAAAAAEAKAAAMGASAEQLLAAGLGTEAQKLQRQAAEQRKRAGAAPPPGRRLDLLEGFVARAGARAEKAAKGAEAAELALARARSTEEALQKELAEGMAKLQQLRAETAAGEAPGEAPALALAARELLQALETRAFATTGAPEPVLAAMCAQRCNRA